MSIYSNAKWQGMNLRLSNLFNIKFVDYQAPKGFDIKLISSSSDYMPFMPENFNFRGRTHTEETKKKMSATQKAKRAAGIPAPQSSEEFRKAASIRQRGKV